MADGLGRCQKRSEGEGQVFLIVSIFFVRKLYSEPLRSKRPEEVKNALKRIVARAPKLSYTISSDRGIEFTGKTVTNYIDSLGVKQRYKDVGDTNAIAVVDRSMGLLKRKLANIKGATGANWNSKLQKATQALNNEPK